MPLCTQHEKKSAKNDHFLSQNVWRKNEKGVKILKTRFLHKNTKKKIFHSYASQKTFLEGRKMAQKWPFLGVKNGQK